MITVVVLSDKRYYCTKSTSPVKYRLDSILLYAYEVHRHDISDNDMH